MHAYMNSSWAMRTELECMHILCVCMHVPLHAWGYCLKAIVNMKYKYAPLKNDAGDN